MKARKIHVETNCVYHFLLQLQYA